MFFFTPFPPPHLVVCQRELCPSTKQINETKKQNLVMFERFDYSLDSKHFVNKIPCLTSLSLTVKK